jgi:hypothetical protein
MPKYVRKELLYGLQRPLYLNAQWLVRMRRMETMRRVVDAGRDEKLEGHGALPDAS